MDRPQPVTDALRRDLANLTSLNRHWGGHATALWFCRRWLEPGRSYRVLDLCTGAADIPRRMIDWARRNDVTLSIDGVDLQTSTLAIAREFSGDYPEIRFIEHDVLRFETNERYDVVCCSLALHHFSDDDAVELLRRCKELSAQRVFVADLERTWAARVGIRAITALIYRDPMTKFDARLSARRAFSAAELRDLARRAGWQNFGFRRFLPARQAIFLE
jgi:ubiquinone/menaquinone biosynthesis C-methylase UbiE